MNKIIFIAINIIWQIFKIYNRKCENVVAF